VKLTNLGVRAANESLTREGEQLEFQFIFDYIQTPPRDKRLLIDQFHNLKFPDNGFILKDTLSDADHPFEWNGDHIFTNYALLHSKLT